MFEWLKETLANRKHNQELYRSGKANKNEVRHTTIGWRPDPINEEDGFTPDPGNLDKDDAEYDSSSKHNTTSGNREYYKVVRRK